MQFDPNNRVIKLCAQGINLEGKGEKEEAGRLYLQAWEEAINDFEKFTTAHYVARIQKTTAEKLDWDIKALQFAEKVDDDEMKANYPSLCLNIAKGYEDLKEKDKAEENYRLALSYANFLPDDGYGKMIKNGINSGLESIKKLS